MPDERQWQDAKTLHHTLGLVAPYTDMLQGEKYPTLSVVWPCINALQQSAERLRAAAEAEEKKQADKKAEAVPDPALDVEEEEQGEKQEDGEQEGKEEKGEHEGKEKKEEHEGKEEQKARRRKPKHSFAWRAANALEKSISRRWTSLESKPMYALAVVLDPRFKKLNFFPRGDERIQKIY